MSVKKPSTPEEEFIAKQEALDRHKRAVEKHRQLEKSDVEALRKQHWMKCPKCGFDLHALVFRGVTIDKCFHCQGTFLDAGELEQLAGKRGEFIKDVIDFFKT